jgi:cytoskeletal protein RodZ
MKPGAFGERLKREREMRGVGLEEIASATRISTRFLLALENERWNELPGGVFNRGFIRAVARYLGLDEEALIAEYSLATNERPDVAIWADSPARPRLRLMPWLVLLLVVGAGVGGWLAWQRYAPLIQAWRQPAPGPPRTATPPPAPANPNEVPNLPTAVNPIRGAQSSAQAAASEPEKLLLKIDVAEPREIRVVADGKEVFKGRMRPGQTRPPFEAKESFEVYSNFADKVFLRLNELDMPPLGEPGQAGQIKLNRESLKKP